MKNNILKSVIILSVVILTACSDNSEPRNAVYTTLSQLVESPGFEWFQPEYNKYKPDTAIINQIKAKLAVNNIKFVLFVNPSCACSGTQVQFPSAIKVLHEAGVTEPNYKIYTFATIEDLHPYMSNYKVIELPCFFPLQDSIAGYSIMDSLLAGRIQDTSVVIEKYVLESLK